ncbi:hypothetical protein EVAR_34630_1 [Eumeta japonica]|uniref:Uncharacterized protein n=1 Tax=Eumeta variegata TaxID=151549 RepID=A0A4C1VI58_EUMVA|nr:hypothetical protein EVAR_34630_1 [Eumeta japonica]
MVALQRSIRRMRNGKHRAQAGVAVNERADGLASRAALTKKTAVDYERFPLWQIKKVIMEASSEEWQ